MCYFDDFFDCRSACRPKRCNCYYCCKPTPTPTPTPGPQLGGAGLIAFNNTDNVVYARLDTVTGVKGDIAVGNAMAEEVVTNTGSFELSREKTHLPIKIARGGLITDIAFTFIQTPGDASPAVPTNITAEIWINRANSGNRTFTRLEGTRIISTETIDTTRYMVHTNAKLPTPVAVHTGDSIVLVVGLANTLSGQTQIRGDITGTVAIRY